MSTTPRTVMDAIATSATKRDVAAALGVTAAYLGSVVHFSNDPALARAWSELPADGAYAGQSSQPPRPSASQSLADALVEQACAEAPIDPSMSQREALLLLMVAALRLRGRPDLPRGWVLAFIRAFEAAGHPRPPTAASLRWYRVRLQQDIEAFSEVPSVTRAIRSMPGGTRRKIWRKDEMQQTTVAAEDPNDVRALVREACADSPLDRRRSEEDNVVLLLLALYNITGTMDWPDDWVDAAREAFVGAKAALPTRDTLRWYRDELRDNPATFRTVSGVDPQLIEDLLAR